MSVEVELTNTADAGTYRIAPSDSAHSGLVFRMQSRGEETSMPPIASEQVDDDGVDLVREWIDAL